MIQKIKDVLDGPEVSNFMGSDKTRALVEQEIVSRWGEGELKNYDPYRSALTFKKWLSLVIGVSHYSLVFLPFLAFVLIQISLQY